MKWVFDLKEFKRYYKKYYEYLETEKEQEYVISLWEDMDGKEIYFSEGSDWGFSEDEFKDKLMGCYVTNIHKDWCKSITEGR